MNAPVKRWMRPESVLLAGLLLASGASVLYLRGRINAARDPQLPSGPPPAAAFQTLETNATKVCVPPLSAAAATGLLVGEMRVVAVGSAYPIPYDAEVCPYSGIPQPAINQLDRDGDGMTDEWEIKNGLDKYSATDAGQDPDADGFSNLEEFTYESEPHDPKSHPPYAAKFRFLRLLEKPFPLVFQGVMVLPDGRRAFQINTPADGKSWFPEIGDEVQGIVVKYFTPAKGDAPAKLTVQRGEAELKLLRGKIIPDPESEAELINVLDHSKKIATMGALLSLNNDEYTVLSVQQNRVVLKRLATGEVFDIVGLAEGGSGDQPEDL